MNRPSRDLVEIFGYAPDDLSTEARALWNLEACPFTQSACTKANHDKSIVYGTCSVTSPYGDCVICPNRLYEKNYSSLKSVAIDAFGYDFEFMTFNEYIPKRSNGKQYIVALGMSSGKEVKLGRQLSMDWVLAKVKNGQLESYVGVEVQSIDITGNYRDSWHTYKNLPHSQKVEIPRSEHGLNWANVHKRLIPQLIRKGIVYSQSKLVPSGLYFIVPDIVYKKFEDIIGDDIPLVDYKSPDVMTVHTYSLSEPVPHGKQRELILNRNLRFRLSEFSDRFIAGASLPSGEELDEAVRKVLGM